MLLTYDEAAAELAVSKRTVERLVQDGELPAVSVRGAKRIPREAVAVFVAGLARRDAAVTSTGARGAALRRRPRRVSSFRSALPRGVS